MDLRERSFDLQELIRSAMDARQMKIWTAIPGIIDSYDPEAMTCSAHPAVQARVTSLSADKQSTTTAFRDIPPFHDCPVVFPSGGGYTLTFPLTAGDECLMIFAHRGIDFWWQQGGSQRPAEARMHNPSDGFILPGPFSQPKALANVSANRVELRSPDDKCTFGFSAAGVTVTGENGNLFVEGNLNSGNGVSGSFMTITGQTVEVTNGLVTNIY